VDRPDIDNIGGIKKMEIPGKVIDIGYLDKAIENSG